MPVQLFTEAERARRDRFPEVITYEDLVIFFTLSDRDQGSIPRSSAPLTVSAMPATLCVALHGLRPR
jgi:hypothetical protein